MSRKYYAYADSTAERHYSRNMQREPLRTDASDSNRKMRCRPKWINDCRINRTIYLTLEEAAEFYSIGLTSLRSIAKDSGAIKNVGRRKWINTNAFDRYLEQFRI